MLRLALAVGLLVSFVPARAADGTAPSASAPASGARVPAEASRASRLVMAQPEVKSWSKAVFAAGRTVAFREDRVSGRPHCIDEIVYEDAGPYLTRYGTWRVCGASVHRLRDD